MWHFYGKLVNRLPLCFRHPNQIFLSNGKHPMSSSKSPVWPASFDFRWLTWVNIFWSVEGFFFEGACSFENLSYFRCNISYTKVKTKRSSRHFSYSRLPITRALHYKLEPRINSNRNRFPLDFRHTFTVILPSETRTLDNSNLPLTRSSFCFLSDHFYINLPSISRIMLFSASSMTWPRLTALARFPRSLLTSALHPL